MKTTVTLILGLALSIGLTDIAAGARVDMPKPGEEPVKTVEITEKDDSVSMTFVVSRTFNFAKLEEIYVFISEPKKPDKDIKCKVSKRSVTQRITFTVPKQSLNYTMMNLTYQDGTDGGDFGGNINVVHMKVGDYYKHYTKESQK